MCNNAVEIAERITFEAKILRNTQIRKKVLSIKKCLQALLLFSLLVTNIYYYYYFTS